jgi:hypothetical protein
LFGLSRTLPTVVWFFWLSFDTKTGLALAFFLSSSNRNRGKAFAVPSEKNKMAWWHISKGKKRPKQKM